MSQKKRSNWKVRMNRRVKQLRAGKDVQDEVLALETKCRPGIEFNGDGLLFMIDVLISANPKLRTPVDWPPAQLEKDIRLFRRAAKRLSSYLPEQPIPHSDSSSRAVGFYKFLQDLIACLGLESSRAAEEWNGARAHLYAKCRALIVQHLKYATGGPKHREFAELTKSCAAVRGKRIPRNMRAAQEKWFSRRSRIWNV
jgi:hypothetical protein